MDGVEAATRPLWSAAWNSPAKRGICAEIEPDQILVAVKGLDIADRQIGLAVAGIHDLVLVGEFVDAQTVKAILLQARLIGAGLSAPVTAGTHSTAVKPGFCGRI